VVADDDNDEDDDDQQQDTAAENYQQYPPPSQLRLIFHLLHQRTWKMLPTQQLLQHRVNKEAPE